MWPSVSQPRSRFLKCSTSYRFLGDLYLRQVDDNGPHIIVGFKYIAVDHFVVSDGVYSEALRESVKKNGSIINWTPELPSSARAFLKDIGDNFDLVKVNYNRKGVKTTSEWRDKWKAEAEGRVASYREAYGSAKALRVLSVTVFPTGHTTWCGLGGRCARERESCTEASEATPQACESSAMAKKVPKKTRAPKKSGI